MIYALIRWGGEDDELYCRVMKKKLTIQSPARYEYQIFHLRMSRNWFLADHFCATCSGTITDLEDMGLIEKLDTLRSTKWKCTVRLLLF